MNIPIIILKLFRLIRFLIYLMTLIQDNLYKLSTFYDNLIILIDKL